MEKYVGLREGKIVWVSDQNTNQGVRLPEQFYQLTDHQLISNVRLKNGQFVDKTAPKEIADLRIALIGVWQINCGVSTYSDYLMDQIKVQVKDYKIFAEKADGEEDPHVERCWERGKSLGELAQQVNDYDPDVVLIQHEYGIFPDARHWLALLSNLHTQKVFVALHSVYIYHHDKTICEAAIPNVIVHTKLQEEGLRAKGFKKPIHVIPHGCLPPRLKPRLWNLYRSEHTFMQFGFGFEYKGWENALQACALLKKEYPDVFYTGLFSESPFSKHLHDNYFNKLQTFIKELGIEENVSLIRGFQADEVLESFFRTNKCAVFPYRENGEHTVLAVTGAARVAMTHGIPVVTSRVPFFSDLYNACLQASSPEELVEQIKKAWADPKQFVDRQDAFLRKNSWANVARMYLEVVR
jgi:glycosyltransferase involved in cell wall biosynthesis